MRWGLLLAMCACGRIGFEDGPRASGDAGGDDATPFTGPRGELDPAFGVDGIAEVSSPDGMSLFDLVARGDGAVAAGFWGPADASTPVRMIAFAVDAAGAPDPSFGTGGSTAASPTPAAFAYSIAAKDGLVVVAGDSDASDARLDDVTAVFLDASGTFVRSVRYDVSGADTANAVEILPRADGTDAVVLCGMAGYETADPHFLIVRLGLDGALDPTWATSGVRTDDFGASSDDECISLAPRPGGGIYAVGRSGEQLVVAGYAADGTRDFAQLYGVSGAYAYAVRLLDGDLIVAGEDQGSSIIVRVGPDGLPRTSFGVGGIARLPAADLLADLAVQPDGQIIGVGLRSTVGVVVRFDGATGQLDPSFATGGVLDVTGRDRLELLGAAFDPRGRLFVTGRYSPTEPFVSLIAAIR